MRDHLSIIGKRFHKLMVIGFFGLIPDSRGANQRFWNCICDCGKTTKVSTNRLNSGNTKSCGCMKLLSSKNNGRSNRIHGLSHTPTGSSWMAMMARCYNKKQHYYKKYGGAGIRVCQFLRASPLNLVELIGERPIGTSIDRIDNKNGYTCGSCDECFSGGLKLNIRWASPSTQARNRSDSVYLTIGGKSKHIREWSEKSGVGYSCIRNRILSGKKGADLISK